MSMHRIHIREVVEIVGVVSIVASLLLLAWEVRQSNRIAATEIQFRLGEQFNDLHRDRMISPEVAKLYPKLASPQSHLVTATEHSQIEGLAWHYVNVYLAAQTAHDNGLVSKTQYGNYSAGAAALVNAYPGLHPQLIRIYGILPTMRDMEIFRPIAELAAQQDEEGDGDHDDGTGR